MNGVIPFARTLRALDADHFRISNLALLLAAALLAGWSWWIFSASIPHYETTERVLLDPGSAPIAIFPPSALARLEIGQSALLRLGDKAIQAHITALDANTIQVRVVLSPIPNPQPLTPSRLQVSVETSRSSPAALLLGALGRATR